MGEVTVGDPNAPGLKEYEKQVGISRQRYWKDQREHSLNQLLVQALQEKGVDSSYIGRTRLLPIEYCIRGFHHATDVLIFSDDDFRDIDLAFDRVVNVDQYIDGLAAGINPTSLKERPVLGVPSEGKIITPIKMLLKGYWGWFSEKNIDGKKEPISKVWPYKAKLSNLGFGENSYLGFYARRTDGKLGWAYFPVRTGEKSKLERFLERERK